jgi:hypothetical protein
MEPLDIIADYFATEGDRPPMPSYDAAARLIAVLSAAGLEIVGQDCGECGDPYEAHGWHTDLTHRYA